MAGMYYYEEGLPEEWVKELIKKDEVMDLCKRYLDLYAEKAIVKAEAEGEF